MRRPTQPLVLFRGVIVLALLAFGLVPLAVPVPVAAAKASISFSRGMAAPGDSVTVTGSGFQPSDTVAVAATFVIQSSSGSTSRQQVSTGAQSDGNGGFTASLKVPDGAAPGVYRVTAQDHHGNAAAQNLAVVALIPLKSGSPGPHVSIVAGHFVYVTGSGFKAGESVTITGDFPLYGGNTLTETKNATADSKGSFGEVQMQVPWRAQNGDVSLTATGQQSGKSGAATAKITVIHRPFLWLSSKDVRPGGSVTVHGVGFVPGAQVTVSVTISRPGNTNLTLSKTVPAGAKGDFQTSLSVPGNVGQGTYTITATGAAAHFHASIPLKVTLSAGIALQPSAVQPGQKVKVSGSGYSAGAQVQVSATFPLSGGGTRAVTTSATTNGNGDFSTDLQVPTQAAGGAVTVTAKGPSTQSSARLTIGKVAPSIVVGPTSAIPGSTVLVLGTGYLPGEKITVTVPVKLASGSTQTVSATATTDKSGAFKTNLRVPGDAAGGSYLVTAKSAAGRSASAKLAIAVLKTSVVAVPTMAVPGTPITVNGFGYASGATITIYLNGQKLGTTTASGAGDFKTTVTVPGNTATGMYTLTAQSSSGQKASIGLRVFRTISTHFYFASLYTGRGYHEYLLFVNTTEIRAVVHITYQPTAGGPRGKTISLNAHARYTEDVNADLGTHVSASAVIATDVPISAERMVLHGTEGALDPGTTSPSTIWYFANGNTSHHYRELIAVQNPNNVPAQVSVRVQPTHSHPFTLNHAMRPQSRTTFALNRYVHDAVGVVVTANEPVVANRTIYIHRGISSKTGVKGPANHWYFASGPVRAGSRHWIGVINTTGRASYLTLHAYGPAGAELGTVSKWIRPYAREGYLMNQIAHQANVAVVVTTSEPSIAEQSAFANYVHDAHTETFGVTNPQKTAQFAEATTWAGQDNLLDVFNPNVAPVPIVVQFLNANGDRTERTYVVPPLAHQRIDVGSVMPNSQLGLLIASNDPFVAEDRQMINNGAGSMSSIGTQT